VALLSDDECWTCGARRGLLVVWYWRPARPFGNGSLPPHLYARPSCMDAAACNARVRKRRDRAQQRAGAIFVHERPCANPPLDACQWCGEPIELADPTDYRRRQRTMHQGDEHEVGDRNCRHESAGARVWNARDALRSAARHAGQTALACADCGEVVEQLGDDGRWRGLQTATVDGRTVSTRVPHWEADHEQALEDGGEHTMENLRCRCVPCHQAKTAREARERAARRSAFAKAEP